MRIPPFPDVTGRFAEPLKTLTPIESMLSIAHRATGVPPTGASA